MTEPYKTTPVFDEESLPEAIRREHRTKPGVWGLLRVLDGQVRLIFADGGPDSHLVTPDDPAPIPPEATHHVELMGPMRMQVEFYHDHPLEGRNAGA
jgi:tellurite resistance-related uncharacterized protein